MFLATAPLLMAAAMTAEPGFVWIDLPSWPPMPTETWYAPVVSATDTGEVLVTREIEAVYGRLGESMLNITNLAPVPPAALVAPGCELVAPEPVGLTRGGAVLVRWQVRQVPPSVGDAQAPDTVALIGCVLPRYNDVWMTWDPVREILPSFLVPPRGGAIIDVFAANEVSEAVGSVIVNGEILGAHWGADGVPATLDPGSVAFSICNSGWTYGQTELPGVGPRAVAWSPDGVAHPIGMLDGDMYSAAMCGLMTSAFGYSQPMGADADHLFVWTMDNGIAPFMPQVSLDVTTALADLPPTTAGLFTTVQTPRDEPGPTGYLVDPRRGMISLVDLMPESFFDEGFTRVTDLQTIDLVPNLPFELGTGDDTIVGIAHMDEPGRVVRRAFALRLNLAGADIAPPYYEVTFADLQTFINAFAVGDTMGDTNLDGRLTFTDITLFLQAFLEER